MFSIHYINLNSRKDRRDHMVRQFKQQEITNYERFEALDGNTLRQYNISVDEICLFKDCDYKLQPFYKNIVGNQLSHLRVLEKIANGSMTHAIVMQDDMVLKKDFKLCVENIIRNWPHNAEIVNIGFHKQAILDKVISYDLENQTEEHIKETINPYIGVIHYSVNPCSSAYIVTKKGASNYIKHVFAKGVHRATDHEFNEYLKAKGIYYGSRLVLCTGAQMGSDIFK